jgi:hypothetical protein
LNRGQSAEVVNGDGVPLRLWVNPRDRRRGVEPAAEGDSRPGTTTDYCQIAADELERQFGDALGLEELDELAASVAGQWRRYGGHACLFLDRDRQLTLTLNQHGDGTCEVVATRTRVELERLLSSLGFPPEAHQEVIARINLGQEVGFRDRNGVQSRLWHDPRAGGIYVRPFDPVLPAVPGLAPPILCPQCTAVLRPWPDGERQQACPLCGCTIVLS